MQSRPLEKVEQENDELDFDFEEETFPQEYNSSESSDNVSEKHGLWDNWMLLAIMAMLCFSGCNIFLSNISFSSFGSLNYFCSGALAFSIFYFLCKGEWRKYNSVLDTPAPRALLDRWGASVDLVERAPKVLLRTWDNYFDWWCFFVIFAGAILLSAIYYSIVMAFKISRQAELNIGVVQSIWAINPFFVLIIERVCTTRRIGCKGVCGMILVVTGSIFICLNDLMASNKLDFSHLVIADEDKK